MDTADVDARAAEKEDGRQHQPADGRTEPPLDHALDEEDRDQPEHEPDGRERGDHRRVVPDRHPAHPADVDEVGDDVRRVREEQEPHNADGSEEGQPSAAAGAVVEDDGEHERDPGEEEVPGEELEVAPVRVADAHREQRHAQARGEDEREECRDPPIGERLHAGMVVADRRLQSSPEPGLNVVLSKLAL